MMAPFLVYALLLAIPISAFGWILLRRWPAPAKKEPGNARTPERIKKEEEILARLQRIKSGTGNVAEAIKRDPKRAARAVRAIMNGKN